MHAEPEFAWHDAERELERGVSRAQDDDFATAATHFDRARELLPGEYWSLRASLAAFIDGQSRYRRAERELHEASRRFAAAAAERQGHLAEVRAILALGVGRANDSGATTPARAPALPGRGGVTGQGDRLPPLRINCFGRFVVCRGQEPLAPCQNRNGQAILRYLATQPRHRATMDELMEALWPGQAPETARHKLHCASSALRRALNSGCAGPKEAGYLLYEDGGYAFNPTVAIRIDCDEFQEHFHAGRRTEGAAAIAAFEAACRLYTGPFLPDDLYADWSALRREQLTRMLLTMCAAIAAHYLQAGSPARAVEWSLRILAEDRCDEAAYRLLMRAHALCGNRAEALRQYERCKLTLAEQLGVPPLRPTTDLYEAILRDEAVDWDTGAARYDPHCNSVC
jgi:DNA-binding SARP family transcriptional activator